MPSIGPNTPRTGPKIHHESGHITARSAPPGRWHRGASHRVGTASPRLVVAGLVLSVVAVLLPPVHAAEAAPVGQGFNLNASDLAFILKQIKISEAHATRENGAGEPVPGGAHPGPQVAGPGDLPQRGDLHPAHCVRDAGRCAGSPCR